MNEPKSREGTMFGHYRLLRMIGKGGMGEVYEAEDTVKDRVVALKLLPEGVSHDSVFRKRLQREAHSAGRLQEPHVVPIHDYGEIDGVLFVDMRMINGADLRNVLKNFGPMTPARAVAIVRQIASALDAAHESGIMHRDVKPENILITRDDFAYLVDFGIANAASEEKLTELGTAVGTYAYMAPERFTSDEVTYRADIYALACVLYECLVGSQPYGGDSIGVVITAHLQHAIPKVSTGHPGIPAAFDDVIGRGMAKNPADRFASAGDLAMAATDALTTRDQDQAETILQRGEAATTPGVPLDSGATMVASQLPAPPSYPPPYGAPPPPVPIGATPASFPTPPPQPYGFTGGPPPPAGGVPAWNAPPPGQNPRGAKKTPWVPIVIVAGVAVLLLGAVGTFFLVTSRDNASGPMSTSSSKRPTAERDTTSRRPRTSTTEPTKTNSFNTQLMEFIPVDYPSSACEPATEVAMGTLATVTCGPSTQPGGPEHTIYSLYADESALNQRFNEYMGMNEETLRCPGANLDSPINWNYKSSPEVVAGQVACGTYSGKADVTWSDVGNLVLAEAQGSDLTDLHNWWLQYS